MFNSNDIKAYHDIKAPDALKQSILSELEGSQKRRTYFPSRAAINRLSAIAACFALVLCAISVATLSNSQITLSYRGSEVGEAGTAITIPAAMPVMMRARTTGISIPLTLEVDGKSEISIEGGSLCLAEMSVLDSSLTLESDESGKIDLLVLPDYGTRSCELTVKSGFFSEVYILELDETASGYTIRKK